MSGHREITQCRLCHSPELAVILNFGDHAITGFFKNVADAAAGPRAPLVLVSCAECGLLQLRHTVDSAILWSADYWYRSGVNRTMIEALEDVVRDGLQYHGEGRWVDIGANDGTLLSRVPPDFERVAVEPAASLWSIVEGRCDRLVRDFWGPSLVEPASCQVITSCAMFYDLDNPHPFVAEIVRALADDGVWINQLSNTPDMLTTTGFDNICHEHICYYDLATLRRLYKQHGLYIVSVKLNDVNGGSIRVVAVKRPPAIPFSAAEIPTTNVEAVKAFAVRVVRWKALMRELLEPLTRDEPMWLYGASTKAVMMLQYLDMNDRFVACADRNPIKHGLVMAGAGLPITDEASLHRAVPRHLFVGPWAFRKEFVERERKLRAAGTTMIFPLPNPEFVL